MISNHKLMIAGAGAGKTTFLVNKALENKGYTLITTFTDRNTEEIKSKIREINKGAIPNNIDVISWDSLMIIHGIRPFLRTFTDIKVSGMKLVNNQKDGSPRGIASNNYKYYMTNSGLVYSDKLANLACNCDDMTEGLVINRLVKCYNHIFIDEAQDLAGYDFEFVRKLLLQNKAKLLLTCDPRQFTYKTHYEKKNEKYNCGHIDTYIFDKCSDYCDIDTSTLNQSYRCRQEICSVSSQLYINEYPEVKSRASYDDTGHDGVFLIREDDINKYLNSYPNIMQLRESKKTSVNENFPVMNMGYSKGATYDRVLIYPTVDMLKWIANNTFGLKPQTRAKFYVALTRARYSSAIVCKDKRIIDHNAVNIPLWS